MLSPKKTKFRKSHKGRIKGVANNCNSIDFGDYALQALEHGKLEARQIEASRVALTRHIKRGGRVWIRVFPDRPYTQKGAETPMGKGKGDPQGYCIEVEPGRILFEIDGVTDAVAKEALRKAGAKLPLKTKVIAR